VGVAVVCDDGNFCTADGCDDEAGCVYTSKAQDSPCDDGNTCSPTSACRDMDSMGNTLDPRQCVATSGLDCNDNDPCTSDACEENGAGPDDDTCQDPREPINEGGGCSNTLCMTGQTCAAGACQGGMALDCDDANTCTADGCEPAMGCTHAPVDETCNDGNPCTLDDACSNGECAGLDVECAPLDSCHQAGSCDASTGTCSDPRKPDGAACGNSGRCQTGSCINSVAEGGAGGEPGGPIGSGGDDSPGAGTSGSGATAPADGGVFVRDPGGCACAVPGERRGGQGVGVLALAALAFAGRLRRGKRSRFTPW
jgi:MYXO-CTERM domain-containing protein